MQQPAITPQQEAIQEVRTRYERGELTFDRFEYAINAILQAETPSECQAIVRELPASPTTALRAPAAPAAPTLANAPGQVRMVNVIGELKRTRRPWKMGQRTTVLMGIGALKLDLSKATIPPSGLLEVYALIGEAKVYVPRNLHVTIRQFTLIGESKALFAQRSGIYTLLDEVHVPAEGPEAATAPHLMIHMMMLIGSVQVLHAGGSAGALPSGLGSNLRGIDLRGMSLEGADFSGKNMEGARLTGSNLRGADFHGANLTGANLAGSNLEDANFSGANLSGAKLAGANLNGANMSGAILDGANLRGTSLDGAIIFGS
jgi:hypothetical protein